jgi:hypothetical protein
MIFSIYTGLDFKFINIGQSYCEILTTEAMEIGIGPAVIVFHSRMYDIFSVYF